MTDPTDDEVDLELEAIRAGKPFRDDYFVYGDGRVTTIVAFEDGGFVVIERRDDLGGQSTEDRTRVDEARAREQLRGLMNYRAG
ncbi:MAG: hypothetical protein H6721_27295 [Sandaracinus sp.]|nr:hypothetical protein [Sandaracinus sp.]MCB9616515.1 hypothetical protein [Sandaracinus sp.]MCB9635840.1 hypothetical protein [Sandaracinus sp.]